MTPIQRMWLFTGIGAVIGLVAALLLGQLWVVVLGIAAGVAAHYLTAGTPPSEERGEPEPGPEPAGPAPRT